MLLCVLIEASMAPRQGDQVNPLTLRGP